MPTTKRKYTDRLQMVKEEDVVQAGPYEWEIPVSYRNDMRVPARFFASAETLQDAFKDRSLAQLVNVATLPGIVEHALAMPDMHEGYGFPIGGVAATLLPDGAISPGGIGYDINCGVRLLLSNLNKKDLGPAREALAYELSRAIPAGTGRGGKLDLGLSDLEKVLKDGVRWALKEGYASRADLEHIESEGRIKEADPTNVSEPAKKRGHNQLGTLGAGNHFAEVGVVGQIFDKRTRAASG